MKKNHSLIPLICITSIISSCNQLSKPLEKGTVITTEQFYKNLEDTTNNGKRFAIEAYPSIGGMTVQVEDNKPHEIYFSSRPTGHGYRYLKGLIPFAKTKNSFYIPTTFTDETLSVFDNDGKEHMNEKVLISFTLQIDTKSKPTTRMITGDMLSDDKRFTTSAYDAEFTDIRIDALNK